MADTISILVELAEKAHNGEIHEYNRLHTNTHDHITCDKCKAIKYAQEQIELADEVETSVVLYIP